MRRDGETGEIKFNLKELGGALGDFGPLHPLFLAYVRITGVNAAAIMLVMGLSNVVIGLYYKLPLPIEPMKAIAIYAISNKWDVRLISATIFGTAITWILLSLTGVLKKILWIVPEAVARGIQLALGIYYILEAWELMHQSIYLALFALMIIIATFLQRRVDLPATLILYTIGITMVVMEYKVNDASILIYTPTIQTFTIEDVLRGMWEVGFAQIFLTLSNAVIATKIAVNERFKRKISDENLALNMGLMNLIAAPLGCIPLCHGVGGFIAQYVYGARTGGSMIIEGVIELTSAILFSNIVVQIFSKFPLSIVGAMLIPVSIELGKSVTKLRNPAEIATAIIVAITSYLTNLGIGFTTGIIVYYAYTKILKQSKTLSNSIVIIKMKGGI